MRTRNSILGSWRSDVAGTEFWFPMLVGCGCKSRWSVILGFDWRNQPSFLGQGSESEMADLFSLSALCDIASSFTPASSLIECIFSSTRNENVQLWWLYCRGSSSADFAAVFPGSKCQRVDPVSCLRTTPQTSFEIAEWLFCSHAPKHSFRFPLNPSFHAQIKHTSTRTSKAFPKDNPATQTT